MLKQGYAYDSVQIWYTAHESTDTNAEMEIDVNICKIRKDKTQETYLDFGFRLLNPANVSKMYIYIPWQIQKSSVKDLSDCFKKDTFLCGLFNENYTRDVSEGEGIFVKKDSVNEFFIQHLSAEDDIEVEDKYSGSVISLKVDKPIINGILQNIPLYIRIRIICPSAQKNGSNGFFHSYRPKFFFFENAFNMLETTDFRINEKRSQQNQDLLRRIKKEKQFNLKKVNYFLIIPFDNELLEGSRLHYQRQLEGGGFWNEYLGKNSSYELGEMCVYSFKDKPSEDCNSMDHFRIFHKIQYRKSSIPALLLYLLVMIVLATICDFVSEMVRHEWIPDFVEIIKQAFKLQQPL